MSALLETKDLKKYFKTPQGWLHAVDDVNLKLNAGETLGVVGESGCGKSTLGRTVLHLLKPTSGRIIFEGQDITNVDGGELKTLRKQMQMIFQDPFSSLNPRFTIRQTIAEPLEIYETTKSRKETNDQVYKLMDTVGLARRLADSYPHELDGGRRQRIGVARAIALNPKFIVCDEPVSALDVSIQAQILNLMQDLQKELGLAYIFITHDLSVVRHISNNISVMYLGKVVEMSPSKELFVKPLHPYTRALLSAIPIPNCDIKRERILLKGEITSPIEPKPGCRFAARCIYARPECSARDPQLREVSPNHYVACPFAEEIAQEKPAVICETI